ncbi:predicted protein [Plenodomus lingam JN3]|uniref:Predicted protein n=1 Tax=Leptosphaeria maculans (strain JN3 / isolate v23.1.3 / race Av1-4-5-6-7-8) TaxID=985895 RepID=E4ZWS5_LEPMJ|nr:predicted protein [Plenodomus lingam JN3]CBX96051.1 predicted protein [Plenodomus lingam JN3]
MIISLITSARHFRPILSPASQALRHVASLSQAIFGLRRGECEIPLAL